MRYCLLAFIAVCLLRVCGCGWVLQRGLAIMADATPKDPVEAVTAADMVVQRTTLTTLRVISSCNTLCAVVVDCFLVLSVLSDLSVLSGLWPFPLHCAGVCRACTGCWLQVRTACARVVYLRCALYGTVCAQTPIMAEGWSPGKEAQHGSMARSMRRVACRPHHSRQRWH